MKILLVDSEDALISKLEYPLKMAGFDCVRLLVRKTAMDVAALFSAYGMQGIVVLGEGLSRKSRTALLDQIRKSDISCPVMTVALPGAFDLINESMTSGLADYICLPLRSKELITRVGILIRQAYPERVEEQLLCHGPYVFSRYPDRVSLRGRDIALTAKEYHLGRLFFEHIGKPLSRMTLSEAVWNSEEDEFSRTIDTHVSRVRNKLGLNEKNGFSLKQVYGFGYQLLSLQV